MILSAGGDGQTPVLRQEWEWVPPLFSLLVAGGCCRVLPDQCAVTFAVPQCGWGDGSSLAREHLALGSVPGSDASSSLPTILVPPHLGPGRPWEPQGAVAALPQKEPLPRGGGPCLPLLVSIGGTAT